MRPLRRQTYGYLPSHRTLPLLSGRHNEARAHTAMFADINVYGTGSVKPWKTRHEKSARIYGYFLQCQRYGYRVSLNR